MKKIFLIFPILIISTLLFTSCENKKIRELKESIDNINKNCPLAINQFGSIIDIKFVDTDQNVQVYFSLNEDILNIEYLESNEEVRNNTLKILFNDKNAKDLLDAIIDAQSDVSFIFKGSVSGKMLKHLVTSSYVMTLYNKSISDKEINQLLLDNFIFIKNSFYPIKLDEGMEEIELYDDGKNITDVIAFDNTIYDISHMQKGLKEIIKKGILDNANNDVLLKLIAPLNKGFKIIYREKQTGKESFIEIKDKEINGIIKK